MAIAGLSFILLAIFWKEFKLLAFDREYGTSLGFPMRKLDVLLTGLITVAIVLGLQTVGVVLMSAMIVAPGSAARQWTNRLGRMVVLAGIFGALAGVIGAMASSAVTKMPTGPSIVLAVGIFVTISLLAAPRRGLIAEALRRRHNHMKLRLDAVLTDLYELESQHNLVTPHGHTAQAIQAMSFGEGPVNRSLGELEQRGLAARFGAERWTITEKGRHRVERLVSRLGMEPDA
jgi:manganese/zinc/iron transport system permease protein